MRTTQLFLWVFLAALLPLVGCSDDDGGSPQPDGTVSTIDGAPAKDTQQQQGEAGSYNLSVKEVGFSSGETDTYSITIEVASNDFSGEVANGRLSISAKTTDLTLSIGVDTTASNTLPGTKATDSAFSDGTFASLSLDNIDYSEQGGGSIAFDVCPSEGDKVKATLTDVKLASTFSQSIKSISGTVQVTVTSDDGSLNCGAQ